MATKKPVTLQDYIDKYLSDNKELTSPKSYEEFIMHGGRGASVVGSEGKLSAEKSYARSLSTYGKRADRLGSDGLTGSGYARYITPVQHLFVICNPFANPLFSRNGWVILI